MHWRRGLLLVVINLVAAIPLILKLDTRDAQYVREREENIALATKEAAARETAPKEELPTKSETTQEGETVSFNPCGMWVEYPPQMRIATFGNLPAATLAQWRDVCPSSWSLSGMLEGKVEWGLTRAKLAVQRKVDMGFCMLIAVQWFLIGAFPLRQPKKWWAEPGAFITVCTVIGACFALIRAVEGAGLVPALVASFAWFWWFGLLVWLTLRFLWQQSARMIATRPN
jgi:hypothetical protein